MLHYYLHKHYLIFLKRFYFSKAKEHRKIKSSWISLKKVHIMAILNLMLTYIFNKIKM